MVELAPEHLGAKALIEKRGFIAAMEAAAPPKSKFFTESKLFTRGKFSHPRASPA
jgi:hypothetical protein